MFQFACLFTPGGGGVLQSLVPSQPLVPSPFFGGGYPSPVTDPAWAGGGYPRKGRGKPPPPPPELVNLRVVMLLGGTFLFCDCQSKNI